MLPSSAFDNLQLPGGCVLIRVELVQEPMVDAIGRKADARSRIVNKMIEVSIRAELSEVEWSVSLYHEVLEAVTVACDEPPESVIEFGESDFEVSAYVTHEKFGSASPENLKRMLQSFGFS